MLPCLSVNRMIKENSDLFSDSQCKVCSAVLISESQKLAHYQVRFHIHIDSLYDRTTSFVPQPIRVWELNIDCKYFRLCSQWHTSILLILFLQHAYFVFFFMHLIPRWLTEFNSAVYNRAHCAEYYRKRYIVDTDFL